MINYLCKKVKNNIAILSEITYYEWLTHCGLVMLYGNADPGQDWLRQWFVAWWHQTITWAIVD